MTILLASDLLDDCDKELKSLVELGYEYFVVVFRPATKDSATKVCLKVGAFRATISNMSYTSQSCQYDCV